MPDVQLSKTSLIFARALKVMENVALLPICHVVFQYFKRAGLSIKWQLLLLCTIIIRL